MKMVHEAYKYVHDGQLLLRDLQIIFHQHLFLGEAEVSDHIPESLADEREIRA